MSESRRARSEPAESAIAPERDVYANRTLNMRSVAAVGYDMDYTLIHYRVDEWEGAAFTHARELLGERGLPVDGLTFVPDQFIQGLVIDTALGNVVKATRFGYVISATHGTTELPFERLREMYAGVTIELGERRFRFLNTMFSISEASLYAQLVDSLDAGRLTDSVGPIGYDDLHHIVAAAVDETHATELLKSKIIAQPERFVDLDPGALATLLDQRLAGKKVMLITNSGWPYTDAMMTYAFGSVAGSGGWRGLFDYVVCAAGKPRFFQSGGPVWRLVDESRGLFAPHVGQLVSGEVYQGGDATLIEASLGVSGDEILYVGDHLFGDVHVSKTTLRWRTALIMRELETEIADACEFEPFQRELNSMMLQKMELESQLSDVRMLRTRLSAEGASTKQVNLDFHQIRSKIQHLDEKIGPLAIRASELGNPAWGPLMRAGSDKSLFARQVEKYADIYTSRVSNLAPRTPYAFYRAARTSLPHDR